MNAHNSENEETSVIMTADHETGGLSLGKADYNSPHSYPVYAWDPSLFKDCRCSTEWMISLIT